MATKKLLVFVTFLSLVFSNEIEDNEQKKRAAAKVPSSLNSIPTGSQKPEYTYLYQQQPQAQPPNSFYPNPPTNQIYNQGESPIYQQPQVTYISPQNAVQNQFVPLNFVPNPGYQSKYQVLPGKSNFQLAILPQSAYLSPPPVYQQQYVSPAQHLPQQSQTYQPQQYQVPQGYPSQPYLGQASMLLYAQPGAPLYNSLYSNAAQQLYSYFQANPQAKYQLLYGNQQPGFGSQQIGFGSQQFGFGSQPVGVGSQQVGYGNQQATYQNQQSGYANQAQATNTQQQQVEYDKALPGPISQGKEDNDLNSNEYISSAESNTSYKNSYSPSRGSSYKP